jgi:branched-chain amino acid transport system ATP-binding protein
MLKLGRALLTQPEVLLLDEPTEGLAPVVVSALGGWLERLRADGLSVLLTEQNAVFALRHADRGYILEKGKVRAEGPARQLRDGSELHDFLGVGRGDGVERDLAAWPGKQPGEQPGERP